MKINKKVSDSLNWLIKHVALMSHLVWRWCGGEFFFFFSRIIAMATGLQECVWGFCVCVFSLGRQGVFVVKGRGNL